MFLLSFFDGKGEKNVANPMPSDKYNGLMTSDLARLNSAKVRSIYIYYTHM